MASIRREVTIHAPAEQLWDALRDVGALHTRLVPGFVTDCLLDGQSRMVTSAQVHAAGANACRVEWIADLLPDELAPAIAGMIEQGLEAMKQNAEQQGGA